MRQSFLAFARPDIGEAEEQAVLEVLRSGWLAMGPRTEAFERSLGEFVGTRFAVGVSSCTAGLHLILRALGVGPGDEVVTSPLTFPATANAVLHAGAMPVFADVLPHKLSLDPDAVERALTPRTRAILPVHLYGWPAEMDALGAIADEAGLPIVEDAAHALGATYRGRNAGTLGRAAAFSFYATKSLTTAEGGVVTTDDEALANQIRLERVHGMDVDASQRDGRAYRHWEAVALGFKYNLSDLQAALGAVQLRRQPELLKRRREIDRRYRAGLSGSSAFEVVPGPAGAETAAHLLPLLLRAGALTIDRDELLDALLAENVGVGVHFRALPQHVHFQRSVPTDPARLPVALDASDRLLSLPLFPGMTDADVDDVLEAVMRIERYYAADRA